MIIVKDRIIINFDNVTDVFKNLTNVHLKFYFNYSSKDGELSCETIEFDDDQELDDAFQKILDCLTKNIKVCDLNTKTEE